MRTSNALLPSVALAVGVSGFSGLASATTYQVGPTRTYKTPGAVAGMLRAGDVVEIDGNATYTGGTVFGNAGTATAPITIRGLRVNGKRPILSGGSNTIEAAGDHYVFEGLEITGGTARCFFHHAHDVVFRDAFVHDCPLQGVLGADNDSGSMLMEYVEVTRAGGGTRDHQVYMATDETTHPGSVFRMQYCYIHDGNGGNNVKSRAERNEIYYNWLEGAVYHELELIGPDPAGGAGTSAREDSDVVGNVLVQTNTFYVTRFGGDGTGETNGRYRFVNNTVIVQPNGSAVFRLFDGLQSVEMHNNVFFSAGAGVNLVRTTEATFTNGRQIAGSNNWIRTGSSAVPPEWTGTLTGADPGFVNASMLNFRPTGTSPLVNAGASSTSGPAGYAFPSPLAAPQFESPQRSAGLPGSATARTIVGTIDIGAYEYSSGSSGSGGVGGSAGAGGSSGAGVGGSSGTAGTGAVGGASGSGGTSASGGSSGMAGAGGSGGSSATGGSGAGGTASGGRAGTAGSGTGGRAGTSTGARAGSSQADGGASEDSGGCGCRAAGSSPTRASIWLGALLFALLRRRGARRSRG